MWLSISCAVAAHVQAVQRAVDAFAVQHGEDVVADQRAAEGERVRREGAAARAVQIHAGDVERVSRLFLHLVVIDHGAGAQPDLCRRRCMNVAPLPTYRSRICAWLASPATTSSRGWDTVGLPSATEAKTTSIGALDDACGAIEDDDAVAEERGVQRCECAACRECRAWRGTARRARGCEASAASRLITCTPFGSRSSDESVRRKPAVHAHCDGAAPLRGGREACVGARQRRQWPGRRSSRRSGATLVKRHCSSFVVGKPSRSKLASALSRSFASHGGCDGDCRRAVIVGDIARDAAR